MTNVREQLRKEVLLEGLVDFVPFHRVHATAESLAPESSVSERQSLTIEAVRSLAADGLMNTGYPDSDGTFVAETLAASMKEIDDNYVAHYDEAIRWFGLVWLELTERGREVILSTEEGRSVDQYEQDRIAANKAAGQHPDPR
jgi:hypothetical protein